jgi:hypothetical protein
MMMSGMRFTQYCTFDDHWIQNVIVAFKVGARAVIAHLPTKTGPEIVVPVAFGKFYLMVV